MSQLMKGSHQGLPNAIQAPGGPFSLSIANNPSLAASNASLQGISSLVNTTIDSTCKIKPQAMPNGTLVFDEKTGRLMIKTEDGMQAINEGSKPTILREETLAFPDGTSITVSLDRVTVNVGDTASFKAYVGDEHIRLPQIDDIIALGFPIPHSELHVFDNLSVDSLRGEGRKSVAFSLQFVGGSAAVDAALLAASMSHLHKPIVGDISFDGGVAKCKAVRSHTGDLSLGADAFANFKTEFERYTVIFS